jgi:hypothetical protein
VKKYTASVRKFYVDGFVVISIKFKVEL